MPEGDTLYRTAVALRKALLDRIVTRFETAVPTVAVVHDKMPVTGRLISAVEARGKHLLITFRESAPSGAADAVVSSPSVPLESLQTLPAGGALVLHTHLRMTGSWHLYRPGERWSKPERYAKAVIHTEAFVAPCFSAPVVELLTGREAERHPDLLRLGPDAITDTFDAQEAFDRLRRHPAVPIGVALMNQRLISGVGNGYKSEVLFLERVSPFAPVSELSDETLLRLVTESHRLLTLNRANGVRRTVFGLSESARLWAYGRSGEPCRVCGATIRMRRQGVDARSTYFCPQCQGTG